MSIFRVRLARTSFFQATVEAESEARAKELAEDFSGYSWKALPEDYNVAVVEVEPVEDED